MELCCTKCQGIERDTFYFIAVEDWNSLPNELKTCENIGFFKKKEAKRHLLQMATYVVGRDFVFF